MSTIMIFETLAHQEHPQCVLCSPKLGKGCAQGAEIIFLYEEILLPRLHIGEERQEPRLESSIFLSSPLGHLQLAECF